MRIGDPLKRSVDAGRIVTEIRSVASRCHVRRTFQKPGDIDADESGRQSSDWSQHTETATDILWDVESRNAIPSSKRAQRTLRRICHEHQMRTGLERLSREGLMHNQELRHRLCGSTRL